MTPRPADLGENVAHDAVDARSLRSGFIRHAAATPERVALGIEGRTLTYGELDAKARCWASSICTALGRTPERVGVFASRSEIAYVGTLAALYAGAAFVPLNHTFPIERTTAMATDAVLDALIVDEASLPQLGRVLQGMAQVPPVVLLPSRPELPDDLEVLREHLVLERELASAVPLDMLPPVLRDDVAYLLFTSGSTGRPKGVGVTHGNVLHFLDYVRSRYAFTADDRFSQTFDQTFDLSVFDLFAAWESGASVYAMRPIDQLAPAQYVKRHGLTVWFSVPSVVALLRKRNALGAATMPTLRYSLFCGEPLPRKSAEAWIEAAPHAELENLYGPTELTIACFSYRWDAATSPAECLNELVPIGRPYDGLSAMLIDDEGRPVVGAGEGELLVSGPQTVPGYWLAPDKTAEKFVARELSPTRVVRFYRTGDRVRRRADGLYFYVGRTDFQVKVLGYRVELGEVEAVLARDPAVVDAVALGWPLEEERALGLVAFVTGDVDDVAALRARSADALPAYMVPATILVIEAMPLNVNGKIDRRALTERLRERDRASVGSTRD